MEIESDMCKGPASRCNSVNLRNPNVHFANSMEIESDMCKDPESRCNSVNLRNPNVHFCKVNTKTTFGKIQFEPTSKVSGIFGLRFILHCDILRVRSVIYIHEIWFCINTSKTKTHLLSLQKEIVK